MSCEPKVPQPRQTRQTITPLQDKKSRPGAEFEWSRRQTGRTPLNYIPFVIKTFKIIKRGSSYYRRIILKQKPPGSTMYRGTSTTNADTQAPSIV